MKYILSQNIDSNKVFLINYSELERRLDPEQYHQERIDAIEKIKSTECYMPLSSVVSFAKVVTKNIKQGDVYVGLENITSEYGEYIETEEKQSISGAAIFEKGDILFPKLRPYLNKVFYATFDGICSTEFYVLKSHLVDAEYLSIFLRSSLVVNQTKHLMTGNTLPRLQTDDVKELLIPIPSKDLQQSVIECYNRACNKKIKKELQAEALLNSIDNYLLGELGIQLPEMKSQTLQDRMFVLNFSEVRGDRLDAEYNNPFKHGAITKVFKMTQYPTALLSSLAKDIFQGVGKNETDDTTYILLKVKNILRGNMIDFSDVEYVKSVPQNKLLLRNDIISPFIGEAIRQIKFSIFNKEEHKYTVDNNTGVIRLKENVNAQYVCEYLCSCLGKMQIERLIGGGGVPFIGTSGAKKLSVIIPPLQKQQEIVDQISSIRKRAKTLQEEGKAILEHAKKEVEQMILGN